MKEPKLPDTGAAEVEYWDRVRVLAGDAPHRFGVELWIHLSSQDGRKVGCVTDYTVEWRERNQAMLDESPATPLLMHREAAQELLDNLWNMGLRPHNLKDDSRLVEALQFHLQDAVKVRDMALPLALDQQQRVRARILTVPEGMLDSDTAQKLTEFVEGRE